MSELNQEQVILFFDLLKLASSPQLFAMIEYANHELKCRNERAVMCLKETFIKECNNRILNK